MNTYTIEMKYTITVEAESQSDAENMADALESAPISELRNADVVEATVVDTYEV